MRILILEDDQLKLQQIVTTITTHTLIDVQQISSISDANSARKMLRNEYYDMVILDIMVPPFLGASPDPQAGIDLLNDLCVSDSDLKVPARILGITQLKELQEELKAEFIANGVTLLSFDSQNSDWQPPLITQIKLHLNAKQAEHDVIENFNYYLGIVCALEVEFASIKKLPWCFKDKIIKGDPTLYIEGEFTAKGKVHRVIAAYCGRMGMSAAAITSMKIIANFRPEILAITGITGAVRGKANLGDVIVAEECWDWGMGKWITENGEKKFLPSPHHLPVDVDLSAAAVRISADNHLLTNIRTEFNGRVPDTVLNVHIGPVASGSAVISTLSMTAHIQSQHRKLIGIEMESYAVYAAANSAPAPRPRVISVKSASDFADDQKNDDFHHYCSYTSARVLQSIVESVI